MLVAIVASGGELARRAGLCAQLRRRPHGPRLWLYAGYTVGLSRRPPVSPLSLFTGLACAAFVTSLPLALGEAALGLVLGGIWPVGARQGRLRAPAPRRRLLDRAANS